MPAIPLIYWIGAALVTGGYFGGKEFGREVGEKTAKVIPYAAGAVGVYAVYQAAKK